MSYLGIDKFFNNYLVIFLGENMEVVNCNDVEIEDKEFKHIPRPLQGIYCIWFVPGNKYYIGQSVDIIQRVTSHFKNPANSSLRYDILENEINCFRYKILEEVAIAADLVMMEQRYIARFISGGHSLYNRVYVP